MMSFTLVALDNLIDRCNPSGKVYLWAAGLGFFMIAAVSGVG